VIRVGAKAVVVRNRNFATNFDFFVLFRMIVSFNLLVGLGNPVYRSREREGGLR